MQTNIIFAPHVDDEVIGCWRLLAAHQVSAVHYFFEVSGVREEEAIASSKRYGFTPVFDNVQTPLAIPEDAVIYVPHIADNHRDHKALNYYAKRLPNRKVYYSVDMNVSFDVLPEEQQKQKRADLLELFPSQSALLERDDKYHLFESYSDSDVLKRVLFAVGDVVVSIASYNKPSNVQDAMAKVAGCNGNIDAIFASFPGCEVQVQHGGIEYVFRP